MRYILSGSYYELATRLYLLRLETVLASSADSLIAYHRPYHRAYHRLIMIAVFQHFDKSS